MYSKPFLRSLHTSTTIYGPGRLQMKKIVFGYLDSTSLALKISDFLLRPVAIVEI